MLSPEHLHPILVNFTAALVPVSFASDVFGRVTRRTSLTHTGWWTLLYATCITPLTGLAGLWWKSKAADTIPPELLRYHQWLGISLAAVLIVLCVWRWRFHKSGNVPSIAYLALAMLGVIGLIIQGELGGKMLFGS
jgi:uncharacterized membrane protein